MSDEWSGARVAQLKVLYAAGLSASQIAAEIGGGVTRNAVIGKTMRLKLPARGKRLESSVPNRIIVRRPAPDPAPRPSPAPAPRSSAPPPRRNQTNSLSEKIAIAEAEPGLPERLKGEKPDGTGIKFIDLTVNNCHWPKGDPLDEDFEFCGARAIPGMSYCSHHCRISYTPSANRSRVHPRV